MVKEEEGMEKISDLRTEADDAVYAQDVATFVALEPLLLCVNQVIEIVRPGFLFQIVKNAPICWFPPEIHTEGMEVANVRDLQILRLTLLFVNYHLNNLEEKR